MAIHVRRNHDDVFLGVDLSTLLGPDIAIHRKCQIQPKSVKFNNKKCQIQPKVSNSIKKCQIQPKVSNSQLTS